MAVGYYLAQWRLTELAIKRYIVTQEQKDISLILNLSSDAILVLQKSAESTTKVESFIERIRFRNKTICDLLCLDTKHDGDVE